ncbi:radical SAM protein [Candidatus Desantisbacteria bacterium CG02_land_8_20_14_3_00_49_13]|nr:MAG: radical SAM protein [Candidatus Desantisbacteria bacterium CG02_land_8_20_14_3_00_49_13]
MGIGKGFSNWVKGMVIKKILKDLPKASRENLINLTKMAEWIAPVEVDKARIRFVRDAFENNHPGVEYAKKILGKFNPKVRDKFATNLMLNHMLINDEIRERFKVEKGFQPPMTILISPSMKCNLRCQGCYAADYQKDDELDLGTMQKIVNEGKEMGCSFFTILGGEPFMYTHLMEFLGQNPDCYFMIYTNGTMLDDAKIKELVKLGNAAIMFSLEGFKKETDERRAPGVFEKVMAAMDRVREAGLLFGYSCYSTRYNVEQIASDEFIDLMIEKGALIGWYFLCLPVGKNPTTEYMPTPQQRLYLKMRRDHIRDTKPIFIVDFWNDAPWVRGCIAARQFIHINHRGDIEPCVFMHFSADNIKTSKLSDALQSPFFKALKNRQPYDDNLYLPCTLIDHPYVIRDVYNETHPKPTHEDAMKLINDPKIKQELDNYSREVKNLFQKVWEEDVGNGMWKVMREETRKKRAGEIVE